MSKIVADNISPRGSDVTIAGVGTFSSSGVNLTGIVTASSGFVGNVTGDATGLSGSPTLSGITSVSTTNLTVNGSAYPATGPLSNRNLIINGAMHVAQRGAGPITFVDNSVEGILTVDRFEQRAQSGIAGAYTVAQSTESPNGFSNSYNVNCTTAGTPASSNIFYSRYYVEAQDIVNSGWDHTDSNSELTFSFYVRADHTATYCVAINAPDTATNSFVKEYTIAAANTWQRVSFQIPGNSGLTINNDNGAGLQIRWLLVAGPDLGTATDGVWNTSSNPWITSNQDNFGATAGNDIWITGVQLEVGSVATPFEHRSYSDELRRCQRYYYKIQPSTSHTFGLGFARNTTLCQAYMKFPVTMRANPTAIETSGTASDYQVFYLTTAAECDIVPSLDYADIEGSDFYFRVASGLTAGHCTKATAKTGSAYLAWSAEL